jgi:magnesium-transporting ATPase (P-type)
MNRSVAFWGLSTTERLRQLQAAKDGLTAVEAAERLRRYGSNRLKPPKRSDVFTLLLAQFKSSLILILFFATALSFFLRDLTGEKADEIPDDFLRKRLSILVSHVSGYIVSAEMAKTVFCRKVR